ncbi:SusC/RagA family TonB-linked outer membrane protein [Pedobacter metabolipauper]|nr:SusC/RagA family TonB-linked outer membrane protein [Pedobacter metabolipauper]
MKLTIMLIVTFLQVNAATYAQKINLKKDNTALLEILKDLRKQSGYNIFYSEENVKAAGPVSVNLSNLSIEAALRKCLKGTGLDFKVVDKNIIISPEKVPVSKQAVKELIITGRVITEQNDPLPGVTVTLKKTKQYVVTDNTGSYKIIAPDEDAVIVFTYMGYATEERKAGKNQTLNIVLKEENRDLNEVVVTALGIKREEKALGYSLTTLKGEEITNATSNNWTDALSGKVAGLNLLRSNGGPAGSNRIILRGETSLSGTSEALIVIDGIVVSSSSGRTTGNGISYNDESNAPTDYGTSINDINPNDIESISVLKGPGATALYGARGAGGAIVITTKLANPKNKGVGVTFSSNVAIETASRFPEYQYEYGQGDTGNEFYSYGNSVDGNSLSGTPNAWGPKFDGQSFFQYDPNTQSAALFRTPWIAHPTNRKDFFMSGQTFTNNLSVEGGTKETSVRLSYNNLLNTWIIPNTGYERNVISLSLNQKVTSKMQFSGKVNYTNRFSDNLPSVGYSNQTIMYSLIRMAPNARIDEYKDYWIRGQDDVLQNRPYNAAGDNPYLIANEMLNKSNRNTVTGYLQTNYQFNTALSLMLKASVDLSYDSRSQQRPKSSRRYLDGMYRTQNIFNQEINADFLLKYKKDLTRLITADISFGGSILKNRYQRDETRAERLFTPGIYSFANSMDVPLSYPYMSRFGVTSLYSLATFGYSNFLYLDVTGRQDWSSTLFSESGKAQGFFYPSANLSFIVSDKFKLPAYVSLLKLRGSVAKVGSGGTTPYLTSYIYESETNFPSGLTNPRSIANPNLKPESSVSIEFGTDIRFFNGRLGADISVYQNNTKDQILRVPVDRASGFSTAVLNSGEVRNRGLEVAMNGAPVKGRKFSWNINGTFTANRNIVLSLADSVQALQLQKGPGSRGFVEAHVGGSMGDLYGLGYERSPDGQIVYQNGYPVKSLLSRLLTNVYPKWKASIGNEFRSGQFRLNILVDAQFGAEAYSHTYANNAAGGFLKSTLPGRYNGLIGNGVIKNTDGTYRPNDVAAADIWTYYSEHFTPDNVEANIFSTDFIKLREARLDYTFKPALMKKLSLQKASIGVYGRDLFIISKWPSFDPEFGTINNGLIQSGFETGQFPATRTIGINLNVQF